MHAGLVEGPEKTATATRETAMEDEGAARRGILIFVAVLVALGVALLVSMTILATIGNSALEETLVRVVAQSMPRPY